MVHVAKAVGMVVMIDRRSFPLALGENKGCTINVDTIGGGIKVVEMTTKFVRTDRECALGVATEDEGWPSIFKEGV